MALKFYLVFHLIERSKPFSFPQSWEILDGLAEAFQGSQGKTL